MAKLEDIDPDLPITLMPLQQDLDYPLTDMVRTLAYLTIDGADVGRFLQWASTNTWRKALEADLQSISEDSEHRPFLSTWLPLYTFRYEFCVGGRHIHDSETSALMERIRAQTRIWRQHQVDLVGIDGYLLPPEKPRKPLTGDSGARYSPVSTLQALEVLDVVVARQTAKN